MNKARWKVWDTAQQARIECRHTGARVRCVGSDPRRAHGLAPTLVLADEPAQWPPSTGERMRAALVTAAGKQPRSLFVALGTRPSDEAHWFARLLTGGADYAQCHAAGPDDPPFQRRTWAKANPSLPAMPDLLAAVEGEAKAAKADPSLTGSVPGFAVEPRHVGHVSKRPCCWTPNTWETYRRATRQGGRGRRPGVSTWARAAAM